MGRHARTVALLLALTGVTPDLAQGEGGEAAGGPADGTWTAGRRTTGGVSGETAFGPGVNNGLGGWHGTGGWSGGGAAADEVGGWNSSGGLTLPSGGAVAERLGGWESSGDRIGIDAFVLGEDEGTITSGVRSRAASHREATSQAAFRRRAGPTPAASP